jgi:hypothetical protein
MTGEQRFAPYIANMQRVGDPVKPKGFGENK